MSKRVLTDYKTIGLVGIIFTCLIAYTVFPVAADTNLVPNPGFEIGKTSSWGPVNWTFVINNGNTPTWSPVAHSGLKSVKISISGTTDAISGQPKSDLIKVLPFTNYMVSAWGKTQNSGGTNGPVVRIAELDANKKWLRTNNLAFSKGTYNWTQKQTEFRTGSDTAYLYIYANIWKGYGSFWLDDIKLSKYAGNKIIINTDKTLSINGKKTFPVFMYGICHISYESSYPCDPSKNTEYLFNGWNPDAAPETSDLEDFVPKYEDAKVYWTTRTTSVNGASVPPLPDTYKTSPYFLAYYQFDEPDGTSPGQTLTALQSAYNTVKSQDPNHPIILNHWTDIWKWRNASDIISWDRYSIKDTTQYARVDSIYEWELRSGTITFKDHRISDFNKPIYALLQANGQTTRCANTYCYIPTKAEARALTYTALSLDVKGIGYWAYILSDGNQNRGLSNNPDLNSYYKQLARELRGLNDVLVLPTYAHSWYGEKDWVSVSLSPNPSKKVETILINRFSYILKKTPSTNKWYLFIVNKDSTSIANVQIKLAGLTGPMMARTLGLETTGSQRANRYISVSNGVFTDSFDGYAAHIYEIYPH